MRKSGTNTAAFRIANEHVCSSVLSKHDKVCSPPPRENLHTLLSNVSCLK